MNEFYQLIQDTVSRSPIGAKAVAVKIGKPYSTMMREVNPNDKGAKVGADTLMDIVRATRGYFKTFLSKIMTQAS